VMSWHVGVNCPVNWWALEHLADDPVKHRCAI